MNERQEGIYPMTIQQLEELLNLKEDHRITQLIVSPSDRASNRMQVVISGPNMLYSAEGSVICWMNKEDIPTRDKCYTCQGGESSHKVCKKCNDDTRIAGATGYLEEARMIAKDYNDHFISSGLSISEIKKLIEKALECLKG